MPVAERGVAVDLPVADHQPGRRGVVLLVDARVGPAVGQVAAVEERVVRPADRVQRRQLVREAVVAGAPGRVLHGERGQHPDRREQDERGGPPGERGEGAPPAQQVGAALPPDRGAERGDDDARGQDAATRPGRPAGR